MIKPRQPVPPGRRQSADPQRGVEQSTEQGGGKHVSVDAVPGRPVRKDGAGRVSRLGHSRDERAGMGFWRILILAEISNFASLRRHLGQSRAAGLARAVKAAIRECFSFVDPYVPFFVFATEVNAS